MSLGRRDFILGSACAAASVPLLSACADGDDDLGAPIAALQLDLVAFAHGVASGDPLAESVILWTRVSEASKEVQVRWQIARDPALRQVVKSDRLTTGPERDHTVHVNVTGLEPGTTYYYAFTTEGRGRSITGRTRTLPRTADRARFAFTSCANYQNGYFNAYRALADRADLDLWIHLGDYIYEYAEGVYGDPDLGRVHAPSHEAVSLGDYRARYAQYRRDPDLQEAHRQHPLIAVWDDHEFANNAYVDGAENHAPATEGDWAARKRQAAQAFLEWLPIRAERADPVPKIFREFAFGELFDLIMLDTRMIARTQQASTDDPPLQNVGNPSVWTDPTRQLLGTEQEAFFLDALDRSRTRGAAWRIIGNQVIFAPTRNPLQIDPSKPDEINISFSDFWDGYQPARARIFDRIVSGGVANVVFLTGDIHASFALEINASPFSPTPPPNFAIELVGPAVTSQAFETTPFEGAAPILLAANKHAKYAEVTRKGYVLVDVTSQRLQAEWYYVRHKLPSSPQEELGASFTCARNSATLVPATVASTPSPTPPEKAPPA
jgi:alkaline phosphatase D